MRMSPGLIVGALLMFAARAPAEPQGDCTFALLTSYASGLVRSLHVNGDRGLVSFSNRVEIVDLHPDGTITLAGTIPSNRPPPPTSNGVYISGNRAVVARGTGVVMPTDVLLYDITNPAAPALLGTQQFAADRVVMRLAIIDDFILMLSRGTNGSLNLSVLDATKPDLETLPVGPSAGRDFVYDGADLVYMLKVTGPVEALSVANLPQMPLVGETDDLIPVPGATSITIAYENNLVYVLDDFGRISVVDATNPSFLILLASGGPPAFENAVPYTEDLEVRNGVAYFVGEGDLLNPARLFAMDVNIPTQPTLRARRNFSGAFPVEVTARGVLLGAGAARHYELDCPCPGDTNGDNMVDFADLNTVLQSFNTIPGDPNYNAAADVDGDDDVDFGDLNVVVSAFNTACA